jgi:uncharacterized protein (DUF58 family)
VRPECARAAARYRLALPSVPLGGRLGERLGRGTGASLEFADFREYRPGDDLRHLDWRAYARTDQLRVRLFRDEAAPVLDVVVDGSASMSVTAAKAAAAADLAAAAGVWARAAGGQVRWLVAGGGVVPGAADLAFDGPPAGLLPTAPLRPRGLRLLLSDFLQPHDAAPQLRRLAAGAAHLYAVQLLDPWEEQPTTAGPAALVDCEDGRRLELDLDAAAVARYRERLARLRGAVAAAVRGCGGSWAAVTAAAPEAMFRSLMAQGVLEPAA